MVGRQPPGLTGPLQALRHQAASAAFAVGLGANVLVGGSQNTIALQPVSVQGEAGVNVAAGLASFQLEYVP